MKEFPSRKIKCLQVSTKGFNGSLICNKAAHRFPSALHLCFVFQFICNFGKKVIVGLPLPTQADNFERQTPIGQTGSLSLSRTTNNYPWKMRLNKFLTHRHIFNLFLCCGKLQSICPSKETHGLFPIENSKDCI